MAETSDRKVPTRRMAFEEALDGVPTHFAIDGDLIASHLISVLSGMFPDGEEYFVRSVRRFRDQVTDPELKREVAGFIGQEAMHGREHRAFNDKLASLGYPTKRVERTVDLFLRTRERVLSARSNLAATAAAEHFTATLAELVLRDEAIRESFGTGVVRDLFVWHALEESEHKAVAFDVYRAVGGTERMRIWTMKFIRTAFALSLVVNVSLSLLGDADARRPAAFWESWKRFRVSPLMSRHVWKQLCEYDRRGFHPNDRDTADLVVEWRERLFGRHGSLNDMLRSGAA